MRINLELSARCRNCINWNFETKDNMDFLKDEECFCGLDNSLKSGESECELLELDTYCLKDNLSSAGFYQFKIQF